MRTRRTGLSLRSVTVLVCIACLLQCDALKAAESDFPEPAPSVKTYDWTLSPAKEPAPALKYKLCRDLGDCVAGNAAAYYNRALMINLEISSGRTAAQLEREYEWYDLPLDKLPLDELRAYLRSKETVLSELKSGTMCESCDWGVRFQDLRGLNVIEVRLPEFQQTRNLARILKLKSRLEIAEKRFDDALETIRQQYQLARHVSAAPIVIGNLIAVAIESLANETVGEWIATEGSPNLYWALRLLPDPMVEFQAAFRMDAAMAFRIFPFFSDVETADRSNEEWQRLLTDAIVSLDDQPAQRDSGHLATRFRVTAMMLKSYPIVKRELIALGFQQTRIEQMPVGKVIALYARESIQHVIDEEIKWFSVPFAQGQAAGIAAWEQLKKDGYLGNPEKEIPLRDPLLLNSRLSSAPAQLNEACNRQRRMIAALLAVEAIRLHAATHEGQLPGSLGEITIVPVPLNPATDKSLLYRVIDHRAELLIPPNRSGDEYSGRRFLLTMRP